MNNAEFDKLVAEGYQRLPAWVREKIRNVAVVVKDEPSAEEREREGLGEGETLLGHYHGVPLTGRTYGDSGLLPDVITLYRSPILDEARASGGDVRDVIADTVWHEFAHHFGMDEEEVRRREDGLGASR